jgi:hypothetical protein
MMDVTNHQALHERAQSRLGIGGNAPPSPIDYAKEAAQELGDYLRENPVIATFDQAKEIGGWIERTRISLSAARDARDTELAPHLEKAAAIRTAYDAVREKTQKNPGGALTRLYEAAKARLTAYNNAEEAKRAAEADRLAQIAAEAEAAARLAEAAEQEAIANAEAGECADVGEAIAEADDAFREYSVANRTAQRAERETKVRIPSAMGGKALGMHKVEIFTIEDACAAIAIMGVSEDLKRQVIKDAKRFREATGELPEGVTSAYERSL